MDAHKHSHGDLKVRAKEELRSFLILTLYLWVLFGSFIVYRRLVTAEASISYLHYGIALIEALIVAKVILIANLFGFTRRFEDRRLIVPVLYKTILFGVLVILFGVVEHLIEGWFRGEGLFGGLRALKQTGADELEARVLVLMVALVPLIAFSEISRALGPGKLSAMFFSKGDRSAGGATPGGRPT